jgi:hypothetical protein
LNALLNIFNDKVIYESRLWKGTNFCLCFTIFWKLCQKLIVNLDIYHRKYKTLIINKMARTKQTARMAVVRHAPKSKGVKKPHRFKPGAIDSDSDS